MTTLIQLAMFVFCAKPLKSKLLGQVFHLYKRYADNGTLLLSYGFCVPQNPHDGSAGLLMNKMNDRIHVHHIYIYIYIFIDVI